MRFAFSRQVCPRFALTFAPLKIEGAGKAGVRSTPRAHRQKRKKACKQRQDQPSHPGFPCTNGFCGLCRSLPGDALCHRRLRNLLRGSPSGWIDFGLRRLDTSRRCQDPTVLPYAASIVRGGPPVNAAHEVLTSFWEMASPCGIPMAYPIPSASIVFRTMLATQQTSLAGTWR
jgi:hypothetical protein